MAYIETRFEALVGGYATACAAAEHAGQFDGLVVAAFGDPGLAGLKELFDVPVVGMTEAALASACLLGQRFSIIAISHRIQAWYRECVAANGLSSRLASVRSLQEPCAISAACRKTMPRGWSNWPCRPSSRTAPT